MPTLQRPWFGRRATLVCALLASVVGMWFCLRLHAAGRQRRAVEAVERMGGRVLYDDKHTLYGHWLAKAGIARQKWLRQMLGDDFFDGAVEIALDYRSLADADPAPLAGLSELRTASLVGAAVPPDLLRVLGQLPHLAHLVLDACTVGDRPLGDGELASLSNLRGLQSLSLNGLAVTDAGLAVLANFRELTRLSLNRNPLTDAALPSIARLPELSWLSLDGCQLTDAGLAPLGAATHLETLFLDRTPLTDAGLCRLKALTQLQFLSLYRTQISDAGLPQLAQLTRLQSVYLDDTRITDAGLPQLAPLVHLECLSLGNTPVTDAGIATLKKALPECRVMR